jgi:hypothetical protein
MYVPCAYSNIDSLSFRERAGASETEQVMEMSSEAKERIAKQFEGHTGETDSENES